MISTRSKETPYCFGKLDKVFPMGEDGLRCCPESCAPCAYKTDCLRTAVAGEGNITLKEEKLDREVESGMVGFLGRWSRKKQLARERRAGRARRD